MKNLLTIVFVAFSFFGLAGHSEIKVDHFTTVSAQGNFQVTLILSDLEKVEILKDDPDLDDDKILVEVTGSELSIKIKADVYKERELEVIVYYKKVNELNSKRGIWMIVKEPLVGDEIRLNCGNGGKIKTEVKCETVKLSISGGGSIKLTGTADIAEYSVQVGGVIAAINLDVASVYAEVSTGGEIICYAKEKLDIKISTGGNVSYKGSPESYSEKIVLGGTIEKLKD
jgi:hypothetical protein